MNISDDMRAAVRSAELTLIAADNETAAMVKLLIGRLRKVKRWDGTETLKSLKRELQSFNASTGKWKEES